MKTYIQIGNPVIGLKMSSHKIIKGNPSIHDKINARGQRQHSQDWKIFGPWNMGRPSTYVL